MPVSHCGSAWVARAPCRDAAHTTPESGAKIASSVSKRLHESPTPPDEHLSGAFKGREQSVKINALFSFCASGSHFKEWSEEARL